MSEQIKRDREMVRRQCHAVALLARTIALLWDDLRTIHYTECGDILLEEHGSRTARLMELLGDTLNGCDAADPTEWLDSVFAEAQKRWPIKGCPHCGEELKP